MVRSGVLTCTTPRTSSQNPVTAPKDRVEVGAAVTRDQGERVRLRRRLAEKEDYLGLHRSA